MAGLGKVTVSIDARIDGLLADLKKSERALARTARNMDRAATALIPSVTLPLAALGTAALASRANLERLENALASALGSGAAASVMLRRLEEDAKKPGVQFESLVRGVVKLNAVGIEAERAREIMLTFGNAIELAGGRASDLDGVQLALGQIISKGKISAEEINQLAERIPQVREAIEKAFGTSNSELLQQAGLPVEAFVDEITKKLGELPQATDSLGNAIESTIDSLKVSLARLGKDIEETFQVKDSLKIFAGVVKELVDSFIALPAPVKSFAVSTLAALAALGPLLKVLSGLTFAKLTLIRTFKSMSETAQTASAAISTFRATSAAAGGGVNGLRAAIAQATQGVSKMSLAFKAAQVAFAAVVIYAAVKAYNALTDSIDAATVAAKRAAEVGVEATRSTAGQVAKTQALLKVVNDSNKSLGQRKEAYRQLKEVAGDFISSNTFEIGQTIKLTRETNKYIEVLKLRATAEATVAKLAERQAERAELAKKDRADELTFFQKYQGLVTGFTASLFTGEQAAESIANITNDIASADFTPVKAKGLKVLDGEIEALEASLASLSGEITKVANQEITFNGGGNGGDLDEQTKRAKALNLELLEVRNTLARVSSTTSAPLELQVVAPRKAQIEAILNELRVDTRNAVKLSDVFSVGDAEVEEKAGRVRGIINKALANTGFGGIGISQTTADIYGLQAAIEAASAVAGTAVPDVRSLGDATALAGEQASLLRSAIESLVTDAGMSEFSPEVQQMAAVLKQLDDALAKSRESMDETGRTAKRLVADVSEAVSNGLQSTISDFAANLGASLGGIPEELSGTQQILISLGDMMQAVGRMIVGAGFAVEKLKLALASFQGAGAIIAGGALVALGAAVKANVRKRAKLYDGGVVYKPTNVTIGDNANAGSDPEIVAPLSRLKAIIGDTGGGGGFIAETRISLDDLLIGLRRRSSSVNQYAA